ncbi:MAG: penicillin acylase family protein [Syntrophales bacterium]|nr:penicillin acylase family protein [Syntrophales bacterium]HOG08050.1 penicillin acylase family protein [Syntrophales bacterium]HPB70229.1 penicillin acylase family protein [Syntrophales bacterium]HQN25720.1 penicillin acylase family protein [Syntrophales bacterium]HQP28351.1 penicillin acylase family protein [Syntrophales bacterium]
MKKGLGIVSVLIVVALGAYLCFQVFFRMAVPGDTGTLEIDGLRSAVEVRFDDYGVPHLFAKNDDDLFFAQGYVAARERLFQMEISRLAGRGELSSLFGEKTLDKDRFLKTIGIHRLARTGYAALSPEARRLTAAYVAGVNACIRDTKRLPREFILLGAKPGRWEPEDCVATVLLMSYSLTRSVYVDLVLYRIGERSGEGLVKAIAPSYPDFAPTLTGRRLSPVPRGLLKGVFHRFAAADPGDIAPGRPVQEMPASNWMIFSGRMTETGKALFAGSPDLKPTLPALFYIMHLKGGSFDVAGGAIPGAPGIGPLGYNGHIVWSAVNGRGDELDYYVEKINPQNPDQYLTETGYRTFMTREETLRIKTKGGLKQETFLVKFSRHGPIVSGVMPMAPAHCAMKWAAFENPATDLEGLLHLNRAKNFTAFRRALKFVRNTNLGVGYADREGNIGWQFTASAPVRKNGDGSYPVPGWTGAYEWTGYLPYERLPYDYNPAAGYVASFNNDPGNASDHLTNYYLFERATRFGNIMKERGGRKVGIEDLRAMQLDTVSVVAQRWVPKIRSACADEAYARYTALFEGWNGAIDIGSPAATLFNAFYARFLKNTLGDEVGPKLWEEGLSQSYLFYIPDLVLARIVDEPGHILYDDTATRDRRETRDDIIRKSLQEAVGQLTDRLGDDPRKWQWGRVHKMYFDHPLGAKLGFFNLKPIPTHGEHHTINSGFWDLNQPFRMDAGGVIRIIVDFARPENSTIISPPGQSGVYKSRHYDDLAQLWADGGQIPLHFFTARDLPNVLRLQPKGR